MIRYYEGVEGAGKTCMMTKDLYLHYCSGGRVWAFPGYKLFGDTRRQVLSEPIMPEDILVLLLEGKAKEIKKQRIVIAMDEVSNFMNHHTWWALLNDIVRAVFEQRRKFGIAIDMTGPQLDVLPPDLRSMIHEVVHCSDKHSFNRSIPRGIWCRYYKEDRRGMLSHPRFPFSYTRKFYMRPWYKHFDTDSIVTIAHRFTKMKVIGKQMTYDSEGNLIESEQSTMSPHNQAFIDKTIAIAAKVEELREGGKEWFSNAEVAKIIANMGLIDNRRTRSMFAARGLAYNATVQGYVLTNEDARVVVA